MLFASPAGAYDAALWPLETVVVGGFAVPNFTSYVAAPVELHVSVAVADTPVAAFAGDGDAGVPGGGGGAAVVVNDHTGPVADPDTLLTVICQKYVVLLASVPGWYELPPAVWPVATTGGGFVVPNRTSTVCVALVPFDENHERIGVTPTFPAPSAGVGFDGVAGGGGIVVLNDQTGPAVLPALFFAITCQKYVVPHWNGMGPIPSLHSQCGSNAGDVRSCARSGGGFVVPNLMS